MYTRFGVYLSLLTLSCQVARILLFIYMFYHVYLHYNQVKKKTHNPLSRHSLHYLAALLIMLIPIFNSTHHNCCQISLVLFLFYLIGFTLFGSVGHEDAYIRLRSGIWGTICARYHELGMVR